MQRISPATFVDTTRKKKFVIFFPFFAPSRGQSSIISGPPAVDSLTFSFFFKDRRFGKVDGICQLHRRRRRVIFFFDSRRSLYTPEERESPFCLSDGTSRPLFVPFCSLNLCVFDSSPPIAVRISLGLVEGTEKEKEKRTNHPDAGGMEKRTGRLDEIADAILYGKRPRPFSNFVSTKDGHRGVCRTRQWPIAGRIPLWWSCSAHSARYSDFLECRA